MGEGGKIWVTILAAAMMPVAAGVGSPAMAQEAAGDWQGVLQANDQARLRIVVHIADDGAGGLTGTIDSPDQNSFGVPLADIVLNAARISFSVPLNGGSFAGEWQESEGTWAGHWSQSGFVLPLTLASGGPPPATRAAPPPLPADWTIPDDAAIAEVLRARIGQRPGAGMVAGVVENVESRIVAQGPEGGRAFDGETLFELGSLTKLFTALLLADMALKGEVSLDDPARDYLPAGAVMPSRGGREITLRDLAMHVSGLPRLPDNMPFSDPADPYADYTEAHLLEFLRGHELTRDIGSRFEYSNLGAGLLSYLLGRAAGSDYATLLRERVTGPRGMEDTAIDLTADQQGRFAPGYDAHMQPAGPWHLPVLAGAGAIRSTAGDMLIFAQAALDPRSPLAAPMTLALEPRAPVAAQTEIALGWMAARIGGAEILFHSGGTGGYRSAIALDRQGGRGVVVLTNSAVEPSAEDVALHLIVGSPLAPTQPVPSAPPPVPARTEQPQPPETLDRVVGEYDFGQGIRLRVFRDGGWLKAQIAGQPVFPIFAESPLRYFWRVVDAQISFTADDRGQVTGAVLHQGGQDLPGRRD